MTPNESGGLRERKKVATRDALSAAALRLALQHGPENVRVEDIAEAAGVSPRTYNNYFSSREQAIVATIEAERALRIGAALRARPADEPLAEAVVEAVVEQYVTDGEPGEDLLELIASAPRVRAKFLALSAGSEQPLTSAIAARTDGGHELAPAVLGAAVSAAARVAAERWLRARQETQEQRSAQPLVVPQGSLADILREALAPLFPALQAADRRLRSSNPVG